MPTPEHWEDEDMKRLIMALAAALLAANYLLVVVATIGVISVIIFLVRLAGMLS
jgi:hypothetical protein